MSVGRRTSREGAVAAAMLTLALVVCVRPNLANATEAWSMVGPACTPLVGGGAVDNITQGTNPYGAYVTFAGSGDEYAYLWCPVWLPQGTYVDTIKVRAYNQVSSTEQVRATPYAQPSISTGGSWASLGYVDAASSGTDAYVTSAGFSSVKICNFNDGTTDCDADTKVRSYFVLVTMRRANYTPKLYSVWLGDPPSDSADMYCHACPIDCGAVLEASEAGARIAPEEMVCLPPRSWDFPWP